MTNSFIQAALATLILGSNVPAFAQPINMDRRFDGGDSHGILMSSDFFDEGGEGKYCFNQVLTSISDGPSTAQLLAMFFEGVVEGADGKVYAVHNDSDGVRGIPLRSNQPFGLYEVINLDGYQVNLWGGPRYSCVEYRLLLEDDDVGQIIYAGNWLSVSPIVLIGVKQHGGDIYGFYEDEESGVWKKKIGEGNAMDGSLVEATNRNGSNGIIGVSTDGRMVGLWGDFNKFVAGRSQTVYCNSKPAGIYEWVTPFRGRYCPANDNGQIAKYTWHGDKSKERDSNLMWETARSITRLSPESGIFGISTQGKLLTLVNDGDTILSVPIRPTLLGDQGIDAVGGVGENDEEGIYVLSEGMVYNVYKESDACELSYNWKASEVFDTTYKARTSTVFGNHDGTAYMLTGYGPDRGKITESGALFLYRLANGDAEEVQSGSLCIEDISWDCRDAWFPSRN